jgi:mono/diheme cytochrome c family protein
VVGLRDANVGANMAFSKPRSAILVSFVCICFIGFLSLAAAGHAQRSAAQLQQGDVQRGKYLVEEVAKCAECHTPRDARGNLDPNAWLQGAPIWITPVRPIQNWADQVPALAGLPSYTDEQMERVLEKGIGPQGEALRPPMHIYHMTPADAKAIIAYLKSLPARSH